MILFYVSLIDNNNNNMLKPADNMHGRNCVRNLWSFPLYPNSLKKLFSLDLSMLSTDPNKAVLRTQSSIRLSRVK